MSSDTGKRIAVDIFGDSHSNNFLPIKNTGGYVEHEVDQFLLRDQVHGELAGSTAYALSYNGSSHGQREYVTSVLDKIDSNHVAFTFGEVDCRNHIYKVAKIEGNSLESVVSDVVARYHNFIVEEVLTRITGQVMLFGGTPYRECFLRNLGVDTATQWVVQKSQVALEDQLVKVTASNERIHVCESFVRLMGKDCFLHKKFYSSDDVHLDPAETLTSVTLPFMKSVLCGK